MCVNIRYFNLSDVPAGETRLYVEIFDEDPRSSGVIGGVAVELSEINSAGRLDKWFPVRRSNGNQAGEVHLILNMEVCVGAGCRYGNTQGEKWTWQ